MRSILSAALAATLAIAASAQDKPKPPPRIAVNDPEKLKDDKDFAAQGEYVGETADKSEKWGAQVIALGDGKFDVKLMMGGLPGDGWNGESVLAGQATRAGDTLTVRHDGRVVGTIANGVFTNADPKGFPLKKVERKSPTVGAKPLGAKVLFAGPGDEANWDGGKIIELSDGKFLNNGIKSKEKFGAFTAHVEFRLPWMPNSRGQGRGNSGVYVQDRYEIQVLDSFGLKGENNECGGVYTMFKPKVNMCYPPMAWQTYDIDFTPATFDRDKKTGNAKLTLKHNGVVIHDGVELKGSCPGGQKETAEPGPFQFQNHGDPVVFRNVWVMAK